MNDHRIEIVHLDTRRPATRRVVGSWARSRRTFVLTSGARTAMPETLPENEPYRLSLVRSLRKPSGRLVGEVYQALPRRR